MRVKRFSKVTDKVKEIGKSIEHTVTHPKETGKKVVEYVKKHPDEAIILGTSDIVPGVVAAKLAKAGKTKQNKQLSQELLQHFLLVVHMYQGK